METGVDCVQLAPHKCLSSWPEQVRYGKSQFWEINHMASHTPKSPAKKNHPLTADLENFRVARESKEARPRHLRVRALQYSASLGSVLALPPAAFLTVAPSPQLGQ